MQIPPNNNQSTGNPILNLTEEQNAIIQSAGDIKINAVAGSGKTTTIIQYAASRAKGAKILYLAFNKSVKLEAKKRFTEMGLHNVQVETAHSLAYKRIVMHSAYKVCQKEYTTYEIANQLGLQDTGEKHGEYILANHIGKFIAYFCNSSAAKVQDLNYLDIVTDEKAKTFVHNFYQHIEKGTRLLLSKMHNGTIDITHDFYLKLFQLSNPVLPYDYILFDEGQDASPAMLDIFIKQKATKVIVGDTHQQIYSWRHAVNSLGKVGFKDYYLSTSFRFGQDIANLSMEVLSWKQHLQEVQPVIINGMGKPFKAGTKATIARTNLGLLLRAISFITEHKDIKHLYFEGNIHSYTYADEGASLYDVLHLYNNKRDAIKDKLIGSMSKMEDLEEYIEKTEDVQLGMMVEIVKEYENEIFSLIKSLKSKHVGDEEKEKAEMIFSTVHRSKGMEYDAVQLVEDFVTERKLEKLKEEKKEDEELNSAKWNEEINLLYVAITRTKGLLRIPEALLPKKVPPSPNIHIIKPKKEEYIKEDTRLLIPAYTSQRRNYYDAEAEKAYSYTEKRRTDKNAYERWTPETDAELKKLYYKGTKLSLIAKHFGRNETAILSRLRKIGCVDFE
jgi:superfamily I DNA/RNA helicase